ncbi:MAG: hypothetical protein IT423_19405 [Pirellulaceae bacterium]|nr:hypothetical protein [Pirellulaceae bacterium]
MRAIYVILGSLIFFCASATDIWAADPEVKFNLLTLPSSRQAELRLAIPAQVDYQHAPLRAIVAQMAERFQFSYWIDRRVDADQPIDLRLTDSNLRECLSKLANLCQAEMGLIENVVTIARPADLASMQYAAVRWHDQLSHQQATANSKNKTSAELKPLQWPMLTTPTELAMNINSTWNISLPTTMPHDLLNAGSLQACTVATQVTLLLGGFGRCAAGKLPAELRLIPLPKAGPWQAVYSRATIHQANVAALANEFPEARLEATDRQWTLVGTSAAHLRLLQSLDQDNRAPALDRPPRNNRSRSMAQPSQAQPNQGQPERDPLAIQKYTISKLDKQPIGAVLNALGSQLGLKIIWDSSLPPSAALTSVTLEAKDAKLDDILQRLGVQAKLSIQRQGTDVEVTAP